MKPGAPPVGIALEGIEGGFASPVHDAQATFRALMGAFAHPATVVRIEVTAGRPPGMHPAMAAAALGLLDRETSVWLSPAFATAAVADWMRFHNGAAVAANAGAATFSFVSSGDRLPEFDRFAHGTDEHPERSATVFIECQSLTVGATFTAHGPGIRDAQRIAISRPDPDLADRLRMLSIANARRFPTGIDLVFTCGASIAAIPRSVRLDAVR